MCKNLVKGMAALCMCAAFASCSHDTDFESAHQSAVFDNLKNQYSANFIKMYGEIDPNQSWDFTSNVNASQARTRSGETVGSTSQDESNNFFGYCKKEFEAIEKLQTANSCDITVTVKGFKTYRYHVTGTATDKTWNNFFSAKLTPSYAYIKAQQVPTTYGTVTRYYHLDFNYNGTTKKDMVPNIKVVGRKDAYWYDGRSTGNIICRHSYLITTLPVENASNVSWNAYYTDETGDGTPHYNDKAITTYREYKVKVDNDAEHTYWGFDCDNDGTPDLICLVRDLQFPDPITKRYMIEDLGTTDDYDFNDIVVDLTDDFKGNQTAIIRAMGGTLDFTLNVDGKPVWTKSVDGPKLTPAINVSDMVNTASNNTNFTKVIAQFPVSGWIPSANNISVTVTYKDASSETGSTIYTIPFPEVGKVPMMFATDPIVNWMYERDNFPEWWLNNHSDDTTAE